MELDEVVAHLEIRQALARYCRGVDRRDVELIRSIYHPDATDDHGMWKGSGWEFAQWIVDQLSPISLAGTHQVTTVYIELQGAVANVESYYIAVNPMIDPATGSEYLMPTGGRYLDRFERRNDQWLIAARVCTIDWSRRELSGESWVGQQSFARVGPRGEDASDALFGRS